jgi:hypothetical protein
MARMVCECGSVYEVEVRGSGRKREPVFSLAGSTDGGLHVVRCVQCGSVLSTQWWQRELRIWREVVGPALGLMGGEEASSDSSR